MSGEQWEMVVPFLPVESKGGPYEDQAYVAGFEMGQLHRDLEARLTSVRDVLNLWTIRTDNVEQADLIAMHWGFVLHRIEDHDGGWTTVEFKAVAS